MIGDKVAQKAYLTKYQLAKGNFFSTFKYN